MKLKLDNRWFVVALLVAVACGVLWPAGAASLSTIRQWLLFAVMVLIGMEQELPAFVRELKKIGSIGLSLGCNYILFPLIAWLVGLLFFRSGEILAGFVVLGAVPVTLTSAVIYTRLDQGNDRLALLITLISQLISVVVTPALIYLFLAYAVDIAVVPMIRSLLLYFLLPLAIGMIIRRALPVSRLVPYLPLPEQAVIALYVFMGSGHIPHDISGWLIVKALIAVMIVQMTVVVLVRFAVRPFPPWDQTALFFTGMQKTLAVGLYLLLTYFPPVAVIPMVLYHVLQLSIGRLYWRSPLGARPAGSC